MAKPTFAPRAATKGIWDNLPHELPYILFKFIDAQLDHDLEMDYLQIFDLSVRDIEGQKVQHIIHRQEQPERCTEYTLGGIENPVDLTVWIVDEGIHAHIMLPEEY